MKLSNVEIIPGIVVKEDDPQHLGRVKAYVPGVFDGENPDNQPWIYPIYMFHQNAFHSPKKSEKIWVWQVKDNLTEYWWMPFFELSGEAKQLLIDYPNTEILWSREQASKAFCQVYYADETGLMLKSDESIVNLDKKGEIQCKSAKGKEVNIQADSVFAGAQGGSYEQAVLGDKLRTLLMNLANNLDNLSTAAGQNPYTTKLVDPFKKAAADLKDDINKILSNNVKIN